MPVDAVLHQVQQLLERGNATEHSYRSALHDLFEALLPSAQALNEPQRAQYGAPDFVISRGSTPVGHVEAKDVGTDLGAAISDSERPAPRTSNGKQLKRYRAALPNLLYTDGLEWHWFVNGDRRGEPVRIATRSRHTA